MFYYEQRERGTAESHCPITSSTQTIYTRYQLSHQIEISTRSQGGNKLQH